MADPDLYYLWLDDKQQGPFTIDQLRSMWSAGRITVKTKFCQESWETWEELKLIYDTIVGDQNFQGKQHLNNPGFQQSPVTPQVPPQVIHIQQPAPSLPYSEPKTRITYQLLAFFLGGLGVHNFYAGRNNVAIVQLMVSGILYWTFVVPIIVWLIAIWELFSVKRDGNGQPMI